MKNMIGIILTGGRNHVLGGLTAERCVAALPVGGKYRAIDFPLSNMVNSQITKVGVITQYAFRSLMDHLGAGKEWDLDRKMGGLFIFPPFILDSESEWYKGSADALYNNISFIQRSVEEYVVIAQGNCIYNMCYGDMLGYHLAKGGDITIAYKECLDIDEPSLSQLGILRTDGDGRVVEMDEKPERPKYRNVSMGVYIMKGSFLVEVLKECAARGKYNLVKDVFVDMLGELKVYRYRFDGYWRSLNNVGVFYRCNMEMLDPGVRQELFLSGRRIYTKVKDETPAKYNEEAQVRNSVVGDGCIIEGTVEDSVLFRGATVNRGCRVKGSIVMQDGRLEPFSSIENVIMDKNSAVSQGTHVRGEAGAPRLIRKGEIV
ncbi:MAG: glucose-1-phosphate adenylyltransferase subunit GlgD [Oscillospiraceae bacterium]|nr:glucose-1-phosphate adenylyltransferase subunit GlgD [Oscillospiraceae bacterium]